MVYVQRQQRGGDTVNRTNKEIKPQKLSIRDGVSKFQSSDEQKKIAEGAAIQWPFAKTLS